MLRVEPAINDDRETRSCVNTTGGGGERGSGSQIENRRGNSITERKTDNLNSRKIKMGSIQGDLTTCGTGNGEKLSNSRAEPGQVIKSAVA